MTSKILILTCMDCRLMNNYVEFMKNYDKKYYHLVLAGSSLGYQSDMGKQYIDNHLSLANKLDNIDKIIIIDHYDCGKYKDCNVNDSKDSHKKNIIYMINDLKEKYKNIDYEGYILSLDNMWTKIF